MTEQVNETANAGEQNSPKFEAITSQEDLDRIVQARLERERKKFADYDEAKAAQARLAKLEESNKTAEQKQQEALAKAERELEELRAAKSRAEVAAAKGVPAELLTGSTAEELEAAADALLAFKGEQQQRLHLPNEGKQISNTSQVKPGVPRLAAAFDEAMNS